MDAQPWYAFPMTTILLLLACATDSRQPEAKQGPDPLEEVAECPAGLLVERQGHHALAFASADVDGVEVAVWAQPLADSWAFQCPDQDSTLHIFWGD